MFKSLFRGFCSIMSYCGIYCESIYPGKGVAVILFFILKKTNTWINEVIQMLFTHCFVKILFLHLTVLAIIFTTLALVGLNFQMSQIPKWQNHNSRMIFKGLATIDDMKNDKKGFSPFVNNSISLLLLLIRNLTSADYRENAGSCNNHTVHNKTHQMTS